MTNVLSQFYHILFFIFIINFLNLNSAFAQTPLGGSFSADTILAEANSPYEMTNTLTVAVGATMTIEAGVEIQFPSAVNIIVNGTLKAIGAPSDSIRFKGTNASPSAHGGRINFTNLSSSNEISYAVLEKMGDLNTSNTAIFIETSDVIFEKSRIFDSERYGIQLGSGVSPIIQQNKIQQCNNFGLYDINAGNSPVLTENIFSNNVIADLRVHASNVGNYLNNEAPYIELTDPVSDTATLPSLALIGGAIYRPLSDLDIEAGAQLTIEAGVEIHFNGAQNINVDGTLIANGTPSDSIRFVGINPASNVHGGRIYFKSQSSNNQISYAVLEKMGENNTANTVLLIETSDVVFEKSRIHDCERYGIQLGSGVSPTIHQNKIQQCGNFGIYDINAGNSPIITENIFSNNVIADLRVHASNVGNYLNNEAPYIELTDPISNTTILPALALVGGAKYRPLSDFDIELGAQLTIEAGVEIQLNSTQNINVDGTLIANGTPTDSIRFVGVHPASNTHGGRIHFKSQSSGNQISYAVLEKMGENNSANAVVLIETSDVTFEKSRIYDSERYGIQLGTGASPTIHQNKIQQCGNFGLYDINAGNSPIVTENIFSNNSISDFRVNVNNVGNYLNNEALFIELFGDVSTTATFPQLALLNGAKYRLNGDLDVDAGAKLTIEPGVEMQFSSSYDINVNGTLIANGTSTDSIKFIGINTNPSTHGGKIHVTSQSSGNEISYAILEKMGENTFANAILLVETSDFVLEKSRVSDSERYGIQLGTNIAPTIHQNKIQQCGNYGIYDINAGNSPFVTQNIFLNNVISDFRVNVNNLGNYLNNQAPFIEINGTVNGTVIFSKLALLGGTKYRLNGDLNIDPNAKLTIEPGVEMQFPSAYNINVNGTLIANGTPSDSIRFIGNNGSPGSHGGAIQLGSQSFGNEISYAILEKLGENGGISLDAALLIKTSSFIFEKNRIRDSERYGIWIDGAVSPTIKDNLLHDHNNTALYDPDPGGSPTFVNNIFQNNTINTRVNIANVGAYSNNQLDFIELTGNLNQAATLPKNAIVGGAGYRLPNTIDTAGVLTIEPGVILEFTNGQNLFVDGTLIAEASETDTIIFLGIDGNGSDGGSIIFTEKSRNSRLEKVVFQFMGNNLAYRGTLNIRSSSFELKDVTMYDNARRGIIITSNASPQINNLTIENNGLEAVEVFSGNPVFKNCTFTGGTNGIRADGGSPIFQNCAIYNSLGNGIINTGTGIVDARTCWWGTDTGPFHPLLNATGQGNEVSDRVWFNPWLMASLKRIQCDSTTLDSLSSGIASYYIFEVPDSLDGTSFLLNLETDVSQGLNEIYGEVNELPQRGNATYVLDTETSLNPSLFLPGLAAGTYYFLVLPSATGVEHISLELEKLDCQIRFVAPEKGGNTGFVTAIVKGADFDQSTTVGLELNGIAIAEAQSVSYQNPGLLFATFDLRNATVGNYDFVVTKMDGDTAHWNQPFDIVEGETIPGLTDNPNASGCSPQDVDVSSFLRLEVESPNFARLNRAVSIIVSYENTSTIDIPIPRRMFVSLRGTPMALELDGLEQGPSQLTLVMREHGGPLNVLRGGAKGTIQVFARVVAGQNGFELLD